MTTLSEIISTLHTVSSLLTKFVQEGDLCFSDKVQLAVLCDKLRDTNTIIECAEQEAKTNIKQLENDAKAMKEEAENIAHTIAANKQSFDRESNVYPLPKYLHTICKQAMPHCMESC